MKSVVEHLVSTIIPVYNREKFLVEAVESVLAQTYRPIEIIISDDGSTDNTLEVARGFASKLDGLVKVLSNPNRGAGAARESGRQAARGEYIQYLDSDDLLWPNKFEDQVGALLQNPGCGIAYGISRLTDMQGSVIASPFKWTGENYQTLFPKLLVDRWWCTHTPLYRRTVCDAAGPWSNLRYSQDWLYDSNIGALGVRLVNCGTIVSDHRTHHSSRQTGHGGWLDPPDRVRFFIGLFENSIKAGVEVGCKEMNHFSRWMFLNSRQCGAMGDAIAAKACCDLAVRAAGEELRDIRVYRRLARAIGWNVMGRITQWMDQFIKRQPGTNTQKQSWMQ